MNSVEKAARGLFDHWQRNVGYSAKLDWDTAPDTLKSTFEGQATAALAALEED